MADLHLSTSPPSALPAGLLPPVLVTGTAGFIGFHVARRLLSLGIAVIGFDSVNAYYDPSLKEARLQRLDTFPHFTFHRGDLADQAAVEALFTRHHPRQVVHLAAQAGVRHSLDHPHDYMSANIIGFLNILEACRHHRVQHLIYASSSSVYGANRKLPFSVGDTVDHPINLYAASKKSNELMAHAYSHLYDIPTTGLRFFTVYGPWGRPDMAMFLFARAILADEPINVFNHGDMLRDFTYVDDVVEAILRLIPLPPAGDPAWDPMDPAPASSSAPWRLYNIGNHAPIRLLDLIALIERLLGKPAIKRLLPMQPGDVQSTFADVQALTERVDFKPSTPIETGLQAFLDWYQAYYHGRGEPA